MEFRIDRGTLADAVAWAARSLPARSPVPVLGGLLLEAREGALTISGFDYEASVRVDVPAETAAPGGVLVLGRRLLDICRVLPEAPVSCALHGSRLTVDGGGTRFGLSTLPRHEYPALPALPPPCGEVDAAAFAEAVGQVAVAAGRDEALPVLTGVQVRLEGATMTLAATDRYRFAVRVLGWSPRAAPREDRVGAPGPAGQAGAVELVVPGRRLAEISRALAKSGTVRVGHAGAGGGLISFEGGGTRTTLRLLEGRLPRHEKLFALDARAVAVTGRERLAEAVRRVAVVAESNSPVRLDFSPEGTVLLQAGYEDDIADQRLPAELTGAGGGADTGVDTGVGGGAGPGRALVAAPGVEGVSVAFNPAYLLDALTSFTTPRVGFELLGPGQRAVLTGLPDGEGAPAPAAEAEHRHLLMSVRQLS